MNVRGAELNLVFAWAWILAGFVSGMLMGLRFHKADWLGGYASYPRRMYRLGHISFFGLGILNFAFYLTIQSLGAAGALVHIASCCFIAGGFTMPICCWFMARTPKAQFTFSIPVLSLISGAVLTITVILL